MIMTLLFRFNDASLIASVRANARGAGAEKDGVMVMLPGGRNACFLGHVKTLSREVLT
jgi:hypothetical protein